MRYIAISLVLQSEINSKGKVIMQNTIIRLAAVLVIVVSASACSDVNTKRMGYGALHHAACQREQDKAIHPADSACSHNYERDYEQYQREREQVLND